MNILIIDDDQYILNSLTKFFNRMQHNPFPMQLFNFENLPVQIEQLQFVICDILMPEVDGFDVLFKLKNHPHFQGEVILMTGMGTIKDGIRAMKEGAYDYVTKPLDLNELFALTQKVETYIALKKEYHDLQQNNEKLETENESLKKEFSRIVGIDSLTIKSQEMKNLYNTATKFHEHPEIPILIEGETGVGKEVLARFIHYGKEISPTPFIALNCAALTPTLFESELFGYEEGAFTGGKQKGQTGKIYAAQGGSIFLDEIGELPIELQAKLLRVIQEREYYRVGGTKPIKTNTRIICATNQKVAKEIGKGNFRKDLYYRFQTGHLAIPPLRKRKDEIIPLAKLFLEKYKTENHTDFESISLPAQHLLMNHFWEGNIRELKNTIERVLILFNDKEVQPKHLNATLITDQIETIESGRSKSRLQNVELFPLKEEILAIIEEAMEKFKGNKSQVARFLDLSRTELYTYLKKIENEHS